jgi:hypothetical protein
MTPKPRLLTRGLTVGLVAAAIAAALTGCGSPDVTKARLERSLAPTFANLYVQRAAILGETGVTVAGTAATADCDRGGPKVADVGPGANWICMVTFHDDHGQVQTGKFELHAKADATYIAGGPSKLIGLATLTDTTGKDIPNPAFEFDGAFDPNS